MTQLNPTNRRLIDATLAMDLRQVKSLLADGTDTEVFGKSGWTALMYAARDGSIEIARALIESGANVDASDRMGGTALMYASRDGHFEVVCALLAAGANVDAADEDGETALDLAQVNGHRALVELIRSHQAQSQDETQEEAGDAP